MHARSGFAVLLLLAASVIGAAMASQRAASAQLVPDENGVMMYTYSHAGTVYNPKVVAQQGLNY